MHFSGTGENRTQSLLTEMVLHPKDQNMPMLQRRLDEITEEDVWWQDSQKYLDLILEFEKIMDECEAEFQSHGKTRIYSTSRIRLVFVMSVHDIILRRG